MPKRIRLELFATERTAEVHAAMLRQKGYVAAVEQVGEVLWDATGVTKGGAEEPTDFDNEMWLVISRK